VSELANLTELDKLAIMEQYTSEDARREWRRILDKIQRGESIEITRYGERLAVVVPAEWFDQLSEQERAFRSSAAGAANRQIAAGLNERTAGER